LEFKYFINSDSRARLGEQGRLSVAGFDKERCAEADNASEVMRISIDKCVIHLGRGWFMRRVLRVLCLFVSCLSTSAQEKTTPATKSQNAEAAKEAREYANASAAKLPVRRVVLYKNGVGYFEHLGRVRGSQDVHVDFTSAQLNDVLKSLTVLDLSGGRITGVDYNSEAPLARRLATLRLSLGERPTTAEFLAECGAQDAHGCRSRLDGGDGRDFADHGNWRSA
jgi:hypothetical protein